MKKRSILVTVTLLFAAFTLGFLLGRQQGRGTLQLSVPESVLTAPTEAAVAEPVPQMSEPEETAGTEAPQPVFPIDVNAATEDDLTALPGIGPVLAGRILAYREEHGAFTTPEELMNVSGIGEKRMEAIWDLITIGGTS